ncbi:hypothetical protein, partial [Limnospira sp. Paracas R14]|uniref:hypothetical protein n=1 Tax=Limnospira sp. Paracas R14 TaxID=2981108 RepID=UPI0028E0DD06|nr:hypothetical protein [Limnospira sp. Paracas R14]
NWLVCSMADCCTRPYIGRVIQCRNWVKFGENAIAPQKTTVGKGRVYITGWCVRWLTAAPAPTLGVLFNVEIG